MTETTNTFSFALLCAALGDLCVSLLARRYRRRLYFAMVLASAVALSAYTLSNRFRAGGAASPHVISESEIDEALQRAATGALGQREGAIIVMDPRTGRLRALVNPQIAFESSYPPGSTIKPFTALAALRAGLIDKYSRTLCRGEYARAGFALACTHPKSLPAFDTSEALAYSCNYYFGTLGERLSEERLDDTLASFGFGKQTGINTDSEDAGRLLRGQRDARNALGEGEHLTVTPIQLLTAYAALLNGGHLFTPRVAAARDFRPQSHADISIDDEHRNVIAAGMRGAVVYGTAASADLNSLPLYVLGKTGTSTQLGGFRTHGWFIGFASNPVVDPDSKPEKLELAVLVFLYKGHGAQAAEIARPVFAEYARLRQGDEAKGSSVMESVGASAGDEGMVDSNKSLVQNGSRSHLISQSPHLSFAPPEVRVHLVRTNVTKEMGFEDYVLGVVAAEGSTEDQPEALKALAIAVRTFALKNLGRHKEDGYDFCTTTHCQRFIEHSNTRLRSSLSAAVRETEGMILVDESGHLVDSYFSASCGGVTANLQTLWGVRAPTYLRGVRDEYCTTMPHHRWTDVISATDLLRALRSDARSDPGARALTNIVVTQRDETGRAESIAIEGERRRAVSGWDFKIIVGRALGWNLLKSSRFEIARSGSNFVFHGSGFGHGLGLCQEGAHVMAQRGAGYTQILAKYFPGTVVATAKSGDQAIGRSGDAATSGRASASLSATPIWQADILPAINQPAFSAPNLPVHPPRLALSSEHFRISYPAQLQQRDAEHILTTLESARADLLRRAAAAAITVSQFPTLEVFINDKTGDFVGRTGQPWWTAAATKGNWIELQPIEVLRRRGVLETTLRHELAHPLIDTISHGHAPHWLAEGLALYLAGEGPLISRFSPQSEMTVTAIDQKLAHPTSADEMRAAYAAAYRKVSRMIAKEGEASVWLRVAHSA